MRFAYKDEDSQVSLVAFHYSINKPLIATDAGDYNVDITAREPGAGAFVEVNNDVILQPGDVVNYWYYVVRGSRAYQKLDLSWTVPAGPTSPSTTVAAPPGEAPTTPATTGAPPTSEGPPDRCATYPCLIFEDNFDTLDLTWQCRCNISLVFRPGPPDRCATYPCLIFEDNFDTLDLSTWEHEITAGGGGNWEFQYYTNNRSNTYVRDGVLFIKPTLTADKFGEAFLSSGRLDLWGSGPADRCTGNAFYGCERHGNANNYINPIQSGRLRTAHSFDFRYGRVELEAKMPTGDWIWPAIWMLPTNQAYGSWPASGEIDIVESRGNMFLRNGAASVGVDTVTSTLHWGPYVQLNDFFRTTSSVTSQSGTFGTGFHTYVLEWDEKSIRSSVDGIELLSVSPGEGGFWEMGDFAARAPGIDNPWGTNAPNRRMSPFDQEFHLIMNVAVGGTNGFFSDGWTNGVSPKPWRNTSPTATRDFWQAKDAWYPTWVGEEAAMQVNYVRVWKEKPDPTQ
ncbi:beta-1,3-glucan-binding protein [Lingula anatina]|uniref:Beta-1,3-glucan-binding protein n=1 Tax=Lingula anatina TaxID=7574 RepID=A0A1S3JDL1_LINAN|nr:beta-1,3-glucan-binding protein [Lingula anatina]|eukprot:XP_013408261.1 beta-1,3-glucan-binding protein [Lingula anatina]